MNKRIIRLCYRKIITASSQKAWDRYVVNSTYEEYLLQSQFFNQEKKYSSFSNLLLHVKGSEKLHFLVSAGLKGYLQQLSDVIPDIGNSLGKPFLIFKNYQSEIISSDSINNAVHQVAIIFFSEPMIWHNSISDRLLVSAGDGEEPDDGIVTHLLQLQPNLGICSLKMETV